MADQNEIGIDLRLKTQKLGSDIASAGNQIKSGLASSVKGLGETAYEREDRVAALNAKRDAAREAIARRNRNAALDAADMERQRRSFEKNNPVRQPQQGIRIPVQSLLAGLGLGIPGIGAIAGLATLNPVAAILTGTFRLLKSETQLLAREFHKASEQARQQYSKSLTSGFATSFTINRSILAKTIGVSEDEVYQFGGAVGYLNKRLELATRTMTETNATLTASAWNASVLETDFEALRMKMASEVAPAINIITVALDELVKMAINNSETIIRTASKFGWTLATQNSLFLKYASAVLGSVIDKNGLSGAGKMEAPAPVAFMKQMKASQWERMGLVIGSGGGTNYNKNTADNTKQANALLAKLPAEIAAAFTRYMSHNVNNNIPSLP